MTEGEFSDEEDAAYVRARAKSEPLNFEAQLSAGDYARRAGELEAAAAYFNAARTLSPQAPAAHFNLGLLSVMRQDFTAAGAHFERTLVLAPEHWEAMLHLAACLQALGRRPQALDVLAHARKSRAVTPHILFHLAAAYRRLDSTPEAIECLARASVMEEQSVELLSSLAQALFELSAFGAATTACRKVSELRPMDAAASYNFLLALFSSDQIDDAVREVTRADKIGPPSAELLRLKLAVLQKAGRHAEALACCRTTLGLEPEAAWALIPLLESADPAERVEIAKRLQIIVRRTPSSVSGWAALAHAAYGSEGYEASLAVFDEALARTDDAGLRMTRALTLPKVASSPAQIERSRVEMAAQLEILSSGGYRIPDPLKSVNATPFHLAYQGRDEKQLQRKIAETHLLTTPSLAWAAPHCGKPRSPRSKIRIGFISSFFLNHAVGGLMSGIIRSLDRSRFEIIIIRTAGPIDDVGRAINESADGVIEIPPVLESSRTMIASLELDILFYTDIGMLPFTYYLSFSRLARVQVVWPGHPITTGVPAIDAFVSSALMEPANGDDHYTERLIRLSRLPIHLRSRDLRRHRRIRITPPGSSRLYACPVTIFKYHPDLDVLIGRVLRADPTARFAMVVGKGLWDSILLNRLRAVIPDFDARVIALPWLRKNEFSSLLLEADAILDTILFSGGNTSLDCVSLGVPIVTTRGAYMRGRSTAGIYEQLGLPELIAADHDDYVARAVKIANDPAYRESLRDEILPRGPALFEDPTVVRELESLFSELVDDLRY